MKLLLIALTLAASVSLSKQDFADLLPQFKSQNHTTMAQQSRDIVSKVDAEKKIGDLRGLKTLVDGYKNLIKDVYRKKPEDSSLIVAQRSYINANAAYEKYLGAFLEAIREGNQKNLLKDPEFKQTEEDVKQLTEAFIQVVNDLAGDDRNASAADMASTKKLILIAHPRFSVTDIAGAAITIWKAWKDDGREQRNKKADRLQAELSWTAWNPLPPPAASPAPSPKPSVNKP